jgi:hypothetical protein
LAAFKEILAKAAGSFLDLGQAGIFFEPLLAVKMMFFVNVLKF